MKALLFAALLAWTAVFCPSAGAAEAFRCEVLALEGGAKVITASGGSSALREGDLLAEGDSIEVAEDGSVDLAYDRDWRNVVRLEGGSKVRVASVSPAKLDLTNGAVFAKLKELPKSSSFEITTPTAVAAVRGTEYRTVVRDGETEVFNFSPSKVFVYGVDPAGQRMAQPAVLEEGQKTAVEDPGDAPEAPGAMDAGDRKEGEESQKAIETQIDRAVQQGRTGKIQTVAEIERSIGAAKSQTRYDEESRVTDTRRRSFK
jgi:hypothetical protein